MTIIKKIDKFFLNLFAGDIIKQKQEIEKKYLTKKKITKKQKESMTDFERIGIKVIETYKSFDNGRGIFYRPGEIDLATILIIGLIIIPILITIARSLM